MPPASDQQGAEVVNGPQRFSVLLPMLVQVLAEHSSGALLRRRQNDLKSFASPLGNSTVAADISLQELEYRLYCSSRLLQVALPLEHRGELHP